jgi:hypothetical protein
MIIGILAIIELRSFNKSTHQVQYINAEESMSEIEMNKHMDEQIRELDRDFM